MIKPIPPCKGCTSKYENCHTYCEKYIQYEKDWKEYKAFVRSNKRKSQEMDTIEVDRFAKNKNGEYKFKSRRRRK